MKIISAGSAEHRRFEGASDGPASISMMLDESGPGTDLSPDHPAV